MNRSIMRAVTALAFVGALLAPLPAAAGGTAAGGWAVTYLDPAPARFEAGTAHTLGFWVLQHGTHPFGGDFSQVALAFTDRGGEVRTFAGMPLREEAHFAAAFALPAGTYEVKAIQEPFAPHEIGTLTVPGRLKVAPPDPAVQEMVEAQEIKNYWGEIRPPIVPPGSPAVEPAGLAVVEPVAAAPVAAEPAVPWWRQPYLVVTALALAGAVVVAGAVRLRRR